MPDYTREDSLNDLYTYEQEREDALRNDAMTHGQWMSAAIAQWAGVEGAYRPDDEWVLSPYDTWERNPHFTGVSSGRHPEDDCEPDEGWDLADYSTDPIPF
jgi:hypothetical protein